MKGKNQLELALGGSTCVRMNAKEYERIRKESQSTGKSVPELLREAYFSSAPRKVLMNREDVVTLRKDLSRIGNNINQVAKKVNSGLLSGWNNTLDLVLVQFETLTRQIHYGYVER